MPSLHLATPGIININLTLVMYHIYKFLANSVCEEKTMPANAISNELESIIKLLCNGSMSPICFSGNQGGRNIRFEIHDKLPSHNDTETTQVAKNLVMAIYSAARIPHVNIRKNATDYSVEYRSPLTASDEARVLAQIKQLKTLIQEKGSAAGLSKIAEVQGRPAVQPPVRASSATSPMRMYGQRPRHTSCMIPTSDHGRSVIAAFRNHTNKVAHNKEPIDRNQQRRGTTFSTRRFSSKHTYEQQPNGDVTLKMPDSECVKFLTDLYQQGKLKIGPTTKMPSHIAKAVANNIERLEAARPTTQCGR